MMLISKTLIPRQAKTQSLENDTWSMEKGQAQSEHKGNTHVPWGLPSAPGWQREGWWARWRLWLVSDSRALSVAWTGLLAASAAVPCAPAPASAHAWVAGVARCVMSYWRSLTEAWRPQDALPNCCEEIRRHTAFSILMRPIIRIAR